MSTSFLSDVNVIIKMHLKNFLILIDCTKLQAMILALKNYSGTDDSGTSSISCSNVAEEIISEPIQKTIKLINDGNISQFEREKLCEALGKSMNLDIYRDSINL